MTIVANRGFLGFLLAILAGPAWALSITLTAPANNSVVAAGTNITLSANATPTNNSRPITKVEFFRGGTTLIGTDTTSPYSIVWTAAPAGTYTITAKATDSSGATATSTAITVIVNAPPTVSLTSPANDYTLLNIPPPTVLLQAQASDTDGTIASVEFRAVDCNGSPISIATLTAPPYTFNWTIPSYYYSEDKPQCYSIQAVATDNRGAQTSSNEKLIDLNVSVQLTSPANGATFNAPASIPLQVAVNPSDYPTSKVQYYNGTTLIGESTTAPYSFNWTNVPAGTYSLTAYLTSASGMNTVQSAAANVTVRQQALYFIHVDHLNTPRLIADANQVAVWKWDQQEPFGVNAPDENPSGNGAFEFALRFPGQYADKETNLLYNYFRDYDPAIARYVQSDPIGLEGGLNTYSYALRDPLDYADPNGEEAVPVAAIIITVALIAASQSTSFQNAAANAASYWANQQIQAANPVLQNLFGTLGSLAALADPCNMNTTTTVLSIGAGTGAYLGRPFWQYYPAGNAAYSSQWVTRGWGWTPPYAPGSQAASRLALPPWNPGTAVRPVSPGPTQFVGGPGTVAPYANPGYPGYFQPGGGVQYRIGAWPR